MIKIKNKMYMCIHSIAIDVINQKHTCKRVPICNSEVFEMLSVFAWTTNMLVVLATILLSISPILGKEGT